MVNTTGRPTAPLVLSSDEREYLTRQGTPASSCAINVQDAAGSSCDGGDGLPGKAVFRLGVHEHTVGRVVERPVVRICGWF